MFALSIGRFREEGGIPVVVCAVALAALSGGLGPFAATLCAFSAPWLGSMAWIGASDGPGSASVGTMAGIAAMGLVFGVAAALAWAWLGIGVAAVVAGLGSFAGHALCRMMNPGLSHHSSQA